MQGLWKKSFIISTALLVITLVFFANLLYSLTATKTQLVNTSAQLESIQNRLDSVTAQLDSLEPDPNSLKAQNRWMLDSYAELRRQISLRSGKGPDVQLFITPDEPIISDKVKEIAGSYSEDVQEQWGDYERMSRWVMKNITYSQDTYTPVLPEQMSGTVEWEEGFWKMPAEAINDGAGDCEDMAVLLVSMFLNYNERRFPVWVVGIRNDGPEAKAHVAVAFPVENQQLTIIDPAGWYQTIFPVGWGLAAEPVRTAVDTWIAHWEEKMSGAYVYMAFSENIYQDFSNTQEFVHWVLGIE